MKKLNGTPDPRLSAEGLTRYGLDHERATQSIMGGLLGRQTAGTPFLAVLFAPAMPMRFKSFLVEDDGAYLLRSDGVRCRVSCDPIEADDVASEGRLLLIECPGDNHRNSNIAYEIDAVPVPALAMRM